jgi:cell division septation protein DedD
VSAVVREQAGLPSPVAGPIERVAAAEELGVVRDEREWLLSLGPLFEGELANRVRESVARLALPMQSSKEGRFGVKLTIGPFASRATATEAQMQIQQETGFEPKVSWSQPNR